MSSPRQWRRRRDRVLVVGAAPDLKTWRQHNYADKVLALRDQLAGTTGVQHVDVYHDDWCASNRGGICDCEPIVRLRGDPKDN